MSNVQTCCCGFGLHGVVALQHRQDHPNRPLETASLYSSFHCLLLRRQWYWNNQGRSGWIALRFASAYCQELRRTLSNNQQYDPTVVETNVHGSNILWEDVFNVGALLNMTLQYYTIVYHQVADISKGRGASSLENYKNFPSDTC